MHISVKILLAGTALVGSLSMAASAGAAPIVTGPLTAAQFQSLNGSSANYGPPSNGHFTDGPFTNASGSINPLFTGPSASAADSLLLVLSAVGPLSPTASASLTFAGQTMNFTAANFFSTAATGFPSNIMGIANGQVNGISFPTAVHAGADILFGAPLNTLYGGTDSLIGNVTISSTVDLREDVFGDRNIGGTEFIIGNAANSGAEGITGGPTPPPPSVPEPASMALLGTGLLGLGLTARRKRA